MQLALEWHTVYDTSLAMLENMQDSVGVHFPYFLGIKILYQCPKVLEQLPNAILLGRLSALRELVLSGFQLELYAANERPFAYWYASQIIEKHLVCIDAIISILVPGEYQPSSLQSSDASGSESNSMKEMTFQRQFLTAVQLLCMAMYSVGISF